MTAKTYRDLPPAHWISMAVYFALMGLLTLTTFWPNPVEGASPAVLLSIKLLPLLVLLPGLWVGRNTTYIWACFVILLYFMQSSVSAYLREWSWPPTTLMVLSALFFCTAMLKLKTDPGNAGITRQRD